ncbi:hypothetical protein ACA910_013914 [Epithemia clementina (nom. ined.)]
MDDLYLARLLGLCGGTCWLQHKAVTLQHAYAQTYHLPPEFPNHNDNHHHFIQRLVDCYQWYCWPGPEAHWRACYRDYQQRQPQEPQPSQQQSPQQPNQQQEEPEVWRMVSTTATMASVPTTTFHNTTVVPMRNMERS